MLRKIDSVADYTSLVRRKSLPGLTKTKSSPKLNAKPLSTGYAGPTPVRRDGRPIKSCMSAASECSVTSLETSVETDNVTPPRRLHRVAFTHVTVREYSLEVGDNPSVSCGPPVTLGWSYNKKGVRDIDTFEADKVKTGTECRRLSSVERHHLLSTIGGHSERRILNAQFETNLAHQERRDTVYGLGGLGKTKFVSPRERVEILKESAARKFDRARKGTSTAKEQKKLWDSVQEVKKTL